jgi:hypothetical protein
MRVLQEELVHMGMGVDEAGGDDAAPGVDLRLARAEVGADGGDAVPLDPDVPGEARGPGAVHDHAVANHEVKCHRRCLLPARLSTESHGHAIAYTRREAALASGATRLLHVEIAAAAPV